MFCLAARLQLTGYLHEIPNLDNALDWDAMDDVPIACMCCLIFFPFIELNSLDGDNWIHLLCDDCL